MIVSPERAAEVVALDDALNCLAELDQRKSQIIELRFFGGLSIEESSRGIGWFRRYRDARLDICESMVATRDN